MDKQVTQGVNKALKSLKEIAKCDLAIAEASRAITEARQAAAIANQELSQVMPFSQVLVELHDDSRVLLTRGCGSSVNIQRFDTEGNPIPLI